MHARCRSCRRLLTWILPALLLCGGPLGADEKTPVDAFAVALEAMNIDVDDLGYRPKGHWARYPHPNTVPYVMPFFEDLLANPRDTYEFTRTLGNVVEDLLTPELLRAEPKDTKRGKELLYKLGVMLATERRIGGFRVFGMDTSHLDSKVEAHDPLRRALSLLLVVSQTSGGGLDPAEVAKVPQPLRRPLARFVVELIQAHRWIDHGLRHVTPAMRAQVFDALPTLAESTPDGETYFPVLDDVAKVVDEHSLHYGCLKALQAVQNARRALGAVAVPEKGWPDFELRLPTKWGTVLFDSNPVDQQHCADPFLVVRCDVTNSMDGPIGSTSRNRRLSVGLLLGHAGRVGSFYGDSVQDEPVDRADVACGILGCGIVYAAGDGDHDYKTGHWGLGAGLFGLGALIDEGGDDVYRMAAVGQGAAFFGAGLLLDAAGDDEYRLAEGDGQGFGGPGGIGILADRSGNDRYYAEPDARKAGRADYHSKDKVAVSNAQGVGSGRRGDISDGHVWAGGLGALIDVEGDDRYEAGNFSQGLGYWYGTGLLWDGGGNDVYRSVYFTQGSGAHFAIGALIDEGGDDRHELWETAGAALAFGWDVVNAFLIDRGHGNDYYEADRISIGVAEVRSNAFFLDEGGDDTYVVRAKGKFLGDVDERKSYEEPGRTATFPFHLGQVAVFLDLGGTDKYQQRGKEGELTEYATAGDGQTWNVRKRAPSARHGPNVSFGADIENAVLDFLKPWPRREPASKAKVDAPR